MNDLQENTSDRIQTSSNEEKIVYGVNASPYDDPKFKREMKFKYENYNPETNMFTVSTYDSDEDETRMIYAADWEHLPYSEKKCYERKKCSEKEKWLIERAKELVEAYDDYPEWDCNHIHRYQDCDFDRTEIWIDYENCTIEVSLYHVDSGGEIHETLNLESLEEDYYQKVESDFLFNVKVFKDDLTYYIDEYIEGCAEDFIERLKEDEKEEGGDIDVDIQIVSWIDSMKGYFVSWLKRRDDDFTD